MRPCYHAHADRTDRNPLRRPLCASTAGRGIDFKVTRTWARYATGPPVSYSEFNSPVDPISDFKCSCCVAVGYFAVGEGGPGPEICALASLSLSLSLWRRPPVLIEAIPNSRSQSIPRPQRQRQARPSPPHPRKPHRQRGPHMFLGGRGAHVTAPGIVASWPCPRATRGPACQPAGLPPSLPPCVCSRPAL
jgi:hypothetical protein